jgi:hypothetical protein
MTLIVYLTLQLSNVTTLKQLLQPATTFFLNNLVKNRL